MSKPVDTVLVTGAFGQVGKRCTEFLLSRGRTVVGMDLRTDKSVEAAQQLSDRLDAGTLIPAYADLLNAADVRKIVAHYEPGAIVHLAAMYAPPSYRNPRLARRVNVEGTCNIVDAAKTLAAQPLLLKASSAAVYGSRNHYRYPERITPETPVNPIDQYGEDKVLAEAAISNSGLPYAVLRLAAVVSPDGASNLNGDYLLLMRATPGDNRMHTVDARDVGLAFANAVDRADVLDGKVLLIAGDETHLHTHRELEDDLIESVGIGRLGPSASLPGDPDDDRGWSYTGWFDTTESHAPRLPAARVVRHQGVGRLVAGPPPNTSARVRPGDSPALALGSRRAASRRTTRPLRRPVDANRKEVRGRCARPNHVLGESNKKGLTYARCVAGRTSATPMRTRRSPS